MALLLGDGYAAYRNRRVSEAEKREYNSEPQDWLSRFHPGVFLFQPAFCF